MNKLEQYVSDTLTSIGFLVKPFQQRQSIDPLNTIYSNYWIILSGRQWQLDFVLQSARIAVEVQGSYWHGRIGQTSRSIEQLKSIAHDKEKLRIFHSHGWNILRIPEEYIKNNTNIKARLGLSILSLLDL